MRHDLPHMPSLGVSSLDSRPPWRHGGLLFCLYFRGKVTGPRQTELICYDRSGRFAPAIVSALSTQTDDAAVDALPSIKFLFRCLAEMMMLPTIRDDERTLTLQSTSFAA